MGRLPFLLVKRGPFSIVAMPQLTHVLGPVINPGPGKSQTRLARRLSLARSLIDQLPRHSSFHQNLEPSMGTGLALADGLAFQERDYSVSSQYTFEIDCRTGIDEMWQALYVKTRNNIRRAEKTYSVRNVDDPRLFVDFYLKNVESWGRRNRVDFANFAALFSESRQHQAGSILGAFQDDVPIAMTYIVWGHGTMYYLLSTRTFDRQDYGAASLLIWTAMKEAHELGLVLDLDGVYSSGTARFLSNFGGNIKTRLIVRRSSRVYGGLQYFKRMYSRDETYRYT